MVAFEFEDNFLAGSVAPMGLLCSSGVPEHHQRSPVPGGRRRLRWHWAGMDGRGPT